MEDLSLIEDVGNIWNHVPRAREWTPLDPKSAPARAARPALPAVPLRLNKAARAGGRASTRPHALRALAACAYKLMQPSLLQPACHVSC